MKKLIYTIFLTLSAVMVSGQVKVINGDVHMVRTYGAQTFVEQIGTNEPERTVSTPSGIIVYRGTASDADVMVADLGGEVDYGELFVTNTSLTGDDSTAVMWLWDTIVTEGLDDYLYAVYPVVGGTAETHKYNLMNPTDSDAAYRLTFGGTVAHGDTGMTSDGTGYADTHFEPTGADAFDFHMSFFAANDQYDSDTDYGIGVKDPSSSESYYLSSSGYVGGRAHSARMGGSAVYYPTTVSQGFYLVQASSEYTKIFRDGVRTVKSITDGDTVTGQSMYFLSGRNTNGTADDPIEETVIFGSFGKRLSDDQAFTLSQIARSFNARLDRYVDSTYVGRPKTTFPLTINESVNDAVPATTFDADLQYYDTINDHMAMITWNTRGYAANQDLAFGTYGLSPYIIDVDSVDVGDWIAPLDSFGVELVYLTAMEAHGFSLAPIPDSIGQPERLVDDFDGFAKFDSEMNPNMDSDIVRNFVDSCAVYGVIPGVYIHPTKNLNLQPGTSNAHQSWDSLDCVHYDNWMQSYAQFLYNEYGFKYFWIDGNLADSLSTDGKRRVFNSQDFYDALKSVDTSIMITMNQRGDTSFSRFPYDIGSHEEYGVENTFGLTDEQLTDTMKIYDGTNYRIPAELIMNVADQPYHTFWYATSDTGTILRPASEIQDFYQRAIDVGAKFCLNVIPGRNGIVQSEQWDLWRDSIDWDVSPSGEYVSAYQEVYDSLDARGDTPSETVAGYQNTLVSTMQDLDIWEDSTDGLWVFAIEDNNGGGALLNWKDPGTNNATNEHSTSWTALEGFTGDGTNDYINLNWNVVDDGVAAQMEDVGFVFYVRSLGSGNRAYGSYDTSPVAVGLHLTEFGGSRYLRVNSGNQDAQTDSTIVLGLNGLIRRDGDNQIIYANKAEESFEGAANVEAPQDLFVLGRNNNGSMDNPCDDQVSIVWVGKGLSKTKMDALLDAFETYMDANNKGVL